MGVHMYEVEWCLVDQQRAISQGQNCRKMFFCVFISLEAAKIVLLVNKINETVKIIFDQLNLERAH